jgi:hypothetical protein
MRAKMEAHSEETEKAVGDIRLGNRCQFPAEEKIWIVIEGLPDEDSLQLCRKESVDGS